MPPIETAVLRNSEAEIRILNLGGITQSWRLAQWPETRSAVLGYANAEAYHNNPHFMGAIIGRVSNRIAGAQFTLDDVRYVLDQNEPNTTLHGGTGGLSKRIWAMDKDGDTALRLRLRSEDGDQGFPADVDFTVYVRLSGTTVTYDMNAAVTAPTPIAMTQHNYYNLNGKGTIGGHLLQIGADRIHASSGIDQQKQSIAVKGTPFDFTSPTVLTKQKHGALDHNFCLDGGASSRIVLSNQTDAHLNLQTYQHGLQVFAARMLDVKGQLFGLQSHTQFCGLCLEPQAYPNAVNRPDFPSIIVTPDAPYRNVLHATLTEGANP